MNSSAGRHLLRKILGRAAKVLPKGIEDNLAQWWTGYVHEPDFQVFDWLKDAPGLVLDVGANRGHSALSVLGRARKLNVCSIEPNPDHRGNLLLIRLLYPFRFRFHMLAAGERDEELTLSIPGQRHSGLSAQGSLKHDEFYKPHIRERLANEGVDVDDETVFRKVRVKVIPLDSLGLQPDLIKIDVEGFESQALKGLESTLRQHLPALLIEVNEPEIWWPQIEALGYGFYYFAVEEGALIACDIYQRPLNLFCLHESSKSTFSKTLFSKVKKIVESGQNQT